MDILKILVARVAGNLSPKETARTSLRGFLEHSNFNLEKIPNHVLDEIADSALEIAEFSRKLNPNRDLITDLSKQKRLRV